MKVLVTGARGMLGTDLVGVLRDEGHEVTPAGRSDLDITDPSDSYIVRTAWLYGGAGPNFVKTMARLAAERETLDVVDDQRGQPTATLHVARFLLALLESDAPAGVYHATSRGETTWHGFTQEIFRQLRLDPQRVRAITTDALARPAPRPAFSVLGHDKWARYHLLGLPHWQTGLASTIDQVMADARSLQ